MNLWHGERRPHGRRVSDLKDTIKIGTRGSRLALWQAEFVKSSLAQGSPEIEFEIVVIKTTGDLNLDTALSKVGDKGLFTREIENALLTGEIDLAVHSLKDLPTVQPEGLIIAAVSERERPNDVLISKAAGSIAALPNGARVATGSLRRQSQLLAQRPDVEVAEMRGNIPTRIEKFLASDLDAMILAYAGMHRLGLDEHIRQIIPTSEIIPAVGQGAIAVETRRDDVTALVAAFNDAETEVCVLAERAFLRSLEGGCQVPIGANAVCSDGGIRLGGFIGSLDGSRVILESIAGKCEDAESLGLELADRCLSLGANDILNAARAVSAEAA